MASTMKRFLAPVFGYLVPLRFPTLMTLSVALFLSDVVIPDGIPRRTRAF